MYQGNSNSTTSFISCIYLDKYKCLIYTKTVYFIIKQHLIHTFFFGTFLLTLVEGTYNKFNSINIKKYKLDYLFFNCIIYY